MGSAARPVASPAELRDTHRSAINVRRAQRIAFALVLTFACRQEEQPAAHVSIEPANIVIRHGHCATVTLQWEMLRPLDRLRGQPFVFVHLLERAHKVKRTFDHALPAQASALTQYPFDICLSAIAPPVEPVEPGRYILGAGLFDSEWGYRWPLATAGADLGEREYSLGTITVEPNGDPGRIEFRGGWRAPENVRDRQVVVRRTTMRDASILVVERRGENLRLAMRTSGEATIGSKCGAQEMRVNAGEHVVELRACDGAEIKFQPKAGTLIALESVAWK
jgi:hypothetical protein